MRLLMFLFFTFVLSVFVKAQVGDSLTTYYDIEWKECDSSEAIYYRKSFWGVDNKLGVRDYYKRSGNIQMVGFFKDKEGQTKTDSFVYYNENGWVSSHGRFVDNKKEGLWRGYFEEGKKESEGRFLNGKREGKWLFFHTNGMLAAMELYEADSLINMRCWDEGGVAQQVCHEEQFAEFPEGQSALMAFLSSNLHYPPTLRESRYTGRVLASFHIDKEGRLSNVKIAKSDDEQFSKEVLRVIALMPQWTPTISHGRILESNCWLPVVFKLD